MHGATISIIGGIGVASIDTASSGMTEPYALVALHGTPADPSVPSRQCAFGGTIAMQGEPLAGKRYRVSVRSSESPSWTALVDDIYTVDVFGSGTWRMADAAGFFSYVDRSQNVNGLLVNWATSGDERWYVRLEVADAFGTIVDETPAPGYLIRLSNSGSANARESGGAPSSYRSANAG